MKSRPLLAAVLPALALLGTLAALLPAAPASAAVGEGDGFFDDAAGTRTLVWHRNQLKEELHVVATARRESEPWYPCGSYVYPKGTLEIRQVYPLGPIGGYFDADGNLLYKCGTPPTFVPVFPQDLKVRYEPCKAKGDLNFGADTNYSQTTPMVVGGRTVEEQRLDNIHLLHTYLTSEVPTTFCISEFVAGSRPEMWCAGDLFCPREYGSGHIPLQEGALRYLPSPTPGCPMAAKSERKVRKELKQLATRIRNQPRQRWWLKGAFNSKWEFYDEVAKPRAVANCR